MKPVALFKKEIKREIASVNIGMDFEEKLYSLHSFYLLGHKHLFAFDRALNQADSKDIYKSKEYKSLLAIKSQIDDIEHDLMLMSRSNSEILKLAVKNFAQKGPLKSISVHNLSNGLGLKTGSEDFTEESLQYEILSMKDRNDFKTHEKSIQHLAHVSPTLKIMKANIDNLDWLPGVPDRITARTRKLMKKSRHQSVSVPRFNTNKDLAAICSSKSF